MNLFEYLVYKKTPNDYLKKQLSNNQIKINTLLFTCRIEILTVSIIDKESTIIKEIENIINGFLQDYFDCYIIRDNYINSNNLFEFRLIDRYDTLKRTKRNDYFHKKNQYRIKENENK